MEMPPSFSFCLLVAFWHHVCFHGNRSKKKRGVALQAVKKKKRRTGKQDFDRAIYLKKTP